MNCGCAIVKGRGCGGDVDALRYDADITNLPMIDGHTVVGNKGGHCYGLALLSDIEKLKINTCVGDYIEGEFYKDGKKVTPEAGKLYADEIGGDLYRWDEANTSYVKISSNARTILEGEPSIASVKTLRGITLATKIVWLKLGGRIKKSRVSSTKGKEKDDD